MTVADILKAEPQSAGVFRKYGLDYLGCSEHQFEEACRKCSADPWVVKEELFHLRLSLKRMHESFGQLLEDVLHQHNIIKNAIPHVRESLIVAVEHHGTQLCELLRVKSKFKEMMESLEVHLYKEEMILFPEFINLWNKKLHRTDYSLPFKMMHPIKSLESEHESAKAILIDIKELIRYYKMPKNADKHYREVCLKLEFFEKNLIKLIDLENQILFPEALSLERIFTSD